MQAPDPGDPPGEEPRVLVNPGLERRPYGAAEERVVGVEAAERAREQIASWPEYEPTPLRSLAGLAERAGVGSVSYKDESTRFGLGAFKALGGAYAVLHIVRGEVERRTGTAPTSEALRARRGRDVAAEITVSCATAGNHGRAVAWGAELFGARCVIFLPAGVSERRAEAIAAHGADLVRCEGGYDETLERARREAERRGWHVVSDKSLGSATEAVARRVMEGYTLLVEEALEQMAGAPPTHAFVQAGVGGLAAAVCARLWQRYGARRPTFVAVESTEADCLFRSAAAGRPVRVEGPLRTMMGGLACREPSPLAWEILWPGADVFLAVPDVAVADTMRRLAAGEGGDRPVVAGESGAAGTAGFLEASRRSAIRELLGLDEEARVLLVGTEGATDPDIYEEIVGRRPERVR